MKVLRLQYIISSVEVPLSPITINQEAMNNTEIKDINFIFSLSGNALTNSKGIVSLEAKKGDIYQSVRRFGFYHKLYLTYHVCISKWIISKCADDPYHIICSAADSKYLCAGSNSPDNKSVILKDELSSDCLWLISGSDGDCF